MSKQHKTPRQRLFTDEFEIGDCVCVIRTEHGWHDGQVGGVIVRMSETFAVVLDVDDDNREYEVQRPRDIRRDLHASAAAQELGKKLKKSAS